VLANTDDVFQNVFMAGIAFNLILIRVGQNSASLPGTRNSTQDSMKNEVISTYVTYGISESEEGRG
jgi:hypothetical protein